MRKYLRATEMMWLAMSVIALITTIYMLIIGNADNALFCLMITVFCLVMWRLRRAFNRKLEKEAKKQSEAKSKGNS